METVLISINLVTSCMLLDTWVFNLELFTAANNISRFVVAVARSRSDIPGEPTQVQLSGHIGVVLPACHVCFPATPMTNRDTCKNHRDHK